MKLDYGSITLGDESAGDVVIDEGGEHTRGIQAEPLAGGDETTSVQPFQAPRGNPSNVRNFIIIKTHESDAAATEWWNSHPDTLSGRDTLTIHEGSYNGLMTALLQGVQRIEFSGKTTTLRYSFLGKQITTAP